MTQPLECPYLAQAKTGGSISSITVAYVASDGTRHAIFGKPSKQGAMPGAALTFGRCAKKVIEEAIAAGSPDSKTPQRCGIPNCSFTCIDLKPTRRP